MKRTELRRKTGLRVVRKSDIRNKVAPDAISKATRREVKERAEGRCEVAISVFCRGRIDHLHHRKSRRFGDHRAVNLLAVCWPCHNWVHANPAQSIEYGFIVTSFEDPASIAVQNPVKGGHERTEDRAAFNASDGGHG